MRLEPLQTQSCRRVASSSESEPGVEHKCSSPGRVTLVPAWADPKALADGDRLKLGLCEPDPVLLNERLQSPLRQVGYARDPACLGQKLRSLGVCAVWRSFQKRTQSVASPGCDFRGRHQGLGEDRDFLGGIRIGILGLYRSCATGDQGIAQRLLQFAVDHQRDLEPLRFRVAMSQALRPILHWPDPQVSVQDNGLKCRLAESAHR